MLAASRRHARRDEARSRAAGWPVAHRRAGAAPKLLKAPASANGPVLVGIAMKAMTQCGPYKTLPVAKYKEWRVLDLRFLATGMTGLDNSKIPRG